MLIKSLFLLRGLPGAGKSAIAEILSEKGKYPFFSIDDYFIDQSTGEYSFDYKTNHLAYKHCENMTREALSSGCDKVFIHNTFTAEWEMEPYFKMASEMSYNVFVLTVENRHGGKNIHDISSDQIQKMAEKYKVKLF
ncbi:MAG TPA: AAA family ATPase [Spirochaetota bacterium]|nr:AAA family ATPase [Spirochaetota bacterium]HOR44961.1 AAA family ATPase [Spirochaetota bacterium]HPK57375.1 AAA family ATPase [Spirochaetota bacterium]